MADTVNLFGSPVKKGYVIAGAGVVGAAVVYGYVKNKKAASTAAAAASPAAASTSASAAYGTDPYPPDGTYGNPDDPYSTDPATGETYGDEQALGSGSVGYSGDLGEPLVTSTSEFTNNAEWAQYAQQYLTSTVGSDAGTVSAALGAYIAGSPVTADQQTIIEQAIAFAGYPPVAGSTGYPPSVNLQQGSTAPASTTVAVPSVTGQDAAAAEAAITAAGLTPSPSGTPAGTQTVSAESPAAGTQVTQGSVVTLTLTTTTKKTGGGGGSGSAKPPLVVGQTVTQAIAALQGAGFTVGTVYLSGIAGVRQESLLPASEYDTSLVVSQSNLSTYPGGPSTGTTISLIAG